jgi:peptidoglycan/LPS O-acetylase OafA/YrhL
MMVIVSHVVLGYFPSLLNGVVIEGDPSWVHTLANSSATFFYRGGLAVMIFFVLSGFVLTHGYCTHPNTVYLARATVKRYVRLGVPVLVACLIGGVLYKVGLPTALREGIFGSLLFAEARSDYVLWTISYELYGSFLVFAILGSTGEFRGACLATFAICAFFLLGQTAPFIYFSLFAVGGLMRLLWTLGTRGSLATTLFGAALMLAGAWIGGYQSNIAPYATTANLANFFQFKCGLRLDWPLFFQGLGAALIVCGFLFCKPLNRLFATEPLAWLGRISFGSYLLHPFVLSFVEPAVKKNAGMGTESMMLCLSVTLAITLLVAHGFNRMVDEPAVNISNRFARWVIPAR